MLHKQNLINFNKKDLLIRITGHLEASEGRKKPPFALQNPLNYRHALLGSQNSCFISLPLSFFDSLAPINVFLPLSEP